jgi:hypothetical protein
MTVAVNTIVSRAQAVIQDATGVRWPGAELVDWLNDGQREIVLRAPVAGSVTESVTLTADSSRQDLPAGGVMFFRLTRNIGGRAIRAADHNLMDRGLPDWHQALGPAVVHYVADPLNPRSYYVYPRAAGAVELVYSKLPATAAAGGDVGLPDIYANMLLDYVLYRAYSKDAEATNMKALADSAYARFLAPLGGRAAPAEAPTEG